MNIIINRDSVCMGDDMENHAKKYRIDDDSTYEDLFMLLLRDDYFPYISGNNVVWVLTLDTIDCIFSYFTRTSKLSQGLSEKSLYKICNANSRSTSILHLRYYTTPLKWKEKIYSLYHNDEYSMWRDGWLEKTKYCDFVMALGMKL